MDARAEVARVAKVLKRWIMYEKGLSLRWVDEQTGHAYGYTSQVLGTGSPKLHLEGLYEILEVIGMSPAEFWQDVYSEAMAPKTRGPKEPERLVDPEQMDELVTLFREVARRAAQEVITHDQSPPAERRPGRRGERG